MMENNKFMIMMMIKMIYKLVRLTSGGKNPNRKYVTKRIAVMSIVNGAGIRKNHFTFSGVTFLERLFRNECNPKKIPVNCGIKYSKLNANANNTFARNPSPNRENPNMLLPGPKKKSVNTVIITYVGTVFFNAIFTFWDTNDIESWMNVII